MYEGQFYPYVRVDLDPDVTCVVGANESGKSQLLDAIEFALGVVDPEPLDFCRYSTFFTVDSSLRLPHFGLCIGDISEADREVLSALGLDLDESTSAVRFFREELGRLRVFVGDAEESQTVDLREAVNSLPRTFRIDPTRELPDSVPLEYLASTGKTEGPLVASRRQRWKVIDPIIDNLDLIRAAATATPPQPAVLASLLPPSGLGGPQSENEAAAQAEQFELAYQLLVTIGGVDVSTFARLQEALRAENEGFANGLVASINKELSRGLNLRRWWTQDSEFDVQVASRDFDLVFTIRDRTASEYSFAERSSGLKYFLSYLVQYLAHLDRGGVANVLLMDEPDAFLSNQGQQDLLRLFQDFANRSTETEPHQVVFVTHSPFLVDKNHAERVRVLDKGQQDEGTRIVRNAGRNHFEPLRTAFGGFVGETTFIGNCNIMLEGVSDQIYLAGASSLLLASGAAETERLDLNEVTLVPCGSASHVPYMTFLARGRDTDQPAVVVLVDGDGAGDDAVGELKSRGPRSKRILAPKFILQITPSAFPAITSEHPAGPLEIEDLVPVDVMVAAAAAFADEIGLGKQPVPTPEAARDNLSEEIGVLAAVQRAFKDAGSNIRLDKVAVARHVIATMRAGDAEGTAQAHDNFRTLFVKLGERQREAVAERSQADVGGRVNRNLAAFLADHPTEATRSELKVLLETVEGLLDSTQASEEIRKRIRMMRTAQSLDVDLSEPIADFDGLRSQLESLKYAPIFASQDTA